MTPSPQKQSPQPQTHVVRKKTKASNAAARKIKVAKSSLKHGAAARVNTLIAPDDSEAWQNHLDGYRQSYFPADYQENDFVDRLASISWRQARLIGMESALLDFQLCIQQAAVDECYPEEKGNPYLQLVLAWQALARKALQRGGGGGGGRHDDEDGASAPPGVETDIDMESLELVRRYQISLERQFRNTLQSFRQYRQEFSRTGNGQPKASAAKLNPIAALATSVEADATPDERAAFAAAIGRETEDA